MAFKKYAIMPFSDYQNACDQVRSKTGTTELIKSGKLSDFIKNIENGGTDTSADTVTEETLVVGYTAHNAEGESITGVNPYELNATNTTVSEQADLIAQAIELLEEKATYNTIYIGTSEPTVDIGVDGDIYIVRSEA